MPEAVDPPASPYDWATDAVILPSEDPVGLLNATIEAEWTGGSWELALAAGGVSGVFRGISDEALRVLLGGASAKALIDRRDLAIANEAIIESFAPGQEKRGNVREAEERDVVNRGPAGERWSEEHATAAEAAAAGDLDAQEAIRMTDESH